MLQFQQSLIRQEPEHKFRRIMKFNTYNTIIVLGSIL